VKIEELETYVDLSLTILEKKDGKSSYYKFPFKKCSLEDFKEKNYTIPEWFKLEDKDMYCPNLGSAHKHLFKV